MSRSANYFMLPDRRYQIRENEKNYPDLNTLVTMSDMFEISLDKLLKEDKQMVKTIDKERLYGKYYKHKQSIIDLQVLVQD